MSNKHLRRAEILTRLLADKPSTAEAAQLLGLTARQVRRLRACYLTEGAPALVHELRGISCLLLELAPPAKRSVTHSRSFGELIDMLEELKQAVAHFTTRAAERLRKHGMAAGAVTVFINTDRFNQEPQYSNAATFELAHPTDVTGELLEWALQGVERIFRVGFSYKKAGVMLSHLRPAGQLTARMFGGCEYERACRVMRAVDKINPPSRPRHRVHRPDRPRGAVEDQSFAPLASLHDSPGRGAECAMKVGVAWGQPDSSVILYSF